LFWVQKANLQLSFLLSLEVTQSVGYRLQK
jgi:hypothetical protein